MDNLGEMVEFLWEQCVCKEKDAYRNLDNPVGRGRINDFVFNQAMINFYLPVIAYVTSGLAKKDTELRYDDLAYEVSGNKWTDYYYKVEKAVSLMNASGMLEFCTSSKDWDAAESRNPMVKIKR